MLLSRVYVDNFRNLINFSIDFSDFDVLIGENNIGKTNLLIAINKIFSGKNIYFDSNDFNDNQKPIIIILTIEIPYPQEKALFYGYDRFINHAKNEIKMGVKAEWNEDLGEVNVTLNFLSEKDEKDETVGVPWRIRREIVSFYVSASRNLKNELKVRNGGLYELFKSYYPYFTLPLPTLKMKIFHKIEKISLKEGMVDPFLVKIKENLDNLNYQGIMETFDDLDEFIVQNSLELTLKIDSSELKDLTSTFIKRHGVQNELEELNNNLKDLYGVENIESDLNELSSKIISNEELSFSLLPPNDDEFLHQLTLDFGDYPITKHGEGYQNIFNLLIRLLKFFSLVKSDKTYSNFFLIIIEEPESHLHPHLQRNFIISLQDIQKKFSDEGINFQFLVSTHSPFIVSPMNLNSLNFLRQSNDDIFALKYEREVIIDFILDSLQKDESKKTQISYFLDRLFYNNAEIFFSRCVIIFEGETEEGAMTVFGSKVIEGFDKYGISCFNAKGVDNIHYVKFLLSKLEIPHVIIADCDNEESFEDDVNVFLLGKNENEAFECEIIRESPLNKILIAIETTYPNKTNNMIAHAKGKFPYIKGFELNSLEDLVQLNDEDHLEFKKDVKKWMKKGYYFGQVLANNLEKDEIPQKIVDAIIKAKDLANEV